MSYGIRLHVTGDRACFTRPEMKAERVSYDVITPSAARGILEAIYWKPAIQWVVDKIHVLKPIRFESIRRNEVGSKISEANVKRAMNSGRLDGLALVVDEDRQQRASTILRGVAYVIEAHFDIVHAKAGTDDNEAKHHEMFTPPRRQGAVLPPAVPRHPRIRGRLLAGRGHCAAVRTHGREGLRLDALRHQFPQ